MLQVFIGSWALFIGMFMLMIGNGIQGTLLGLRGDIEGFSTFEMSIVMSAYFAGFLLASRHVPTLLRRVGHVRVFAALGSTISAVLILYPALTEVWLWTIGRVIIGYCFCGVYITAESWLNDAADNENRGKTLSLYMIMQMAGVVLAQYLLLLADVSGYVLFILSSVLVSLAFAPILLSVARVPTFDSTKPMSVSNLVSTSPLASVGMFVLGGVFSAQFGMAAVYGTQAGLSVAQISLLVSVTYIGALFAQYPIGWVSDRMDRRVLIIGVCIIGGSGALLAFALPSNIAIILVAAATVGATSNPLYALLIAYANDYLEREDMASASGGFLFINGCGAILGPLIVGRAMDDIGPHAYWGFIASLMIGLSVYGVWRMTRRTTETAVEDLVSYTPISARATPVFAEMMQEVYIETEEEAEAEDSTDGPDV